MCSEYLELQVKRRLRSGDSGFHPARCQEHKLESRGQDTAQSADRTWLGFRWATQGSRGSNTHIPLLRFTGSAVLSRRPRSGKCRMIPCAKNGGRSLSSPAGNHIRTDPSHLKDSNATVHVLLQDSYLIRSMGYEDWTAVLAMTNSRHADHNTPIFGIPLRRWLSA